MVIRVVRSSVCDVVQHVLAVHPVALGDREQPDGTKGSFGVDVEAFAFSAFHVDWELRDAC